jgi:hypothetical protein
VRVYINIRDLFSGDRMAGVKHRMGEVLVRQTQDRLRNGGDDEVKFSPLDFPRPDGTTDHPLFHGGGYLLDHISAAFNRHSVFCGSEQEGSRVLLLGTEGKFGVGPDGSMVRGKLPTIKPVHAKALFIPLTARAAGMTSRERNTGRVAYQHAKAKLESLKAQQSARPNKAKARMIANWAAKKKEAWTQMKKSNTLEQGKDFLLLKKVDIRPRPFLRMSKTGMLEVAQAGFGPAVKEK